MAILNNVYLRVLTVPPPDEQGRLVVIRVTLYRKGQVVGLPNVSIGLIPASSQSMGVKLGVLVPFYGGSVGLEIDKVRVMMDSLAGRQEIIVKLADGREVHQQGSGTMNINIPATPGKAGSSLFRWVALGGIGLGFVMIAKKIGRK